ncbi:MAG TPA: hypothetical protein VFG69_12240 [Nannocystaceae bacterium]|nr:hypothetical protein [Nannocystaceae bacterium]
MRGARGVPTVLDLLAGLALAAAGIATSACETGMATTSEAEEPAEPAAPNPWQGMARKDAARQSAEQPLAPLARSEKRMAFPARGATHLGYNLAALEKLRALAGAVEIPEWSAAADAGSARALRDDDLATAWTCRATPEAACAAGIHFPEPAKVRAVRLFGAAASEPGAYAKHPRVKKVRVHTDEGWAEATLPDEPTHGYVVFGKDVTTRSLVVEIVGTHDEKAAAELHFAELEVYGSEGVAREPWDIDPARMIVRVLGEPWVKADRRWRVGETYLALLDEHGESTLFMRGSALYGRAGDRLLLAEVLADTTCTQHRGQFFLIDQATRVIAPIGDLGGIGADVYRARDGLGFAHGEVDEQGARLAGVLFENESYERRRTQRRSPATGPETLDEWKLDANPLPRGGVAINEALEGCTLGGDDTLAVLTKAAAIEPTDKPGEWMVCKLGERAHAYVTDRGPCGSSWEIIVLTDEQRVVARQSGKRRGSRARLRRWSADALLVEIGGDDDKTELWRVDRAGIIGPIGASALAISPPQACRSRCDDRLVRSE